MDRVIIKITDTLVPNKEEIFGISDNEFIISFQDFIMTLPSPLPTAFPVILKVFDLYPLLFKFRRFSNLNLDERAKILNGWAKSKLYVKRAFFSTLKTLIMLVFYSNEKVEKKLGFERKCLSE